MVLLKNDGILPLKSPSRRIAVVGPLADQTRVLLGNYNGIPTHTVSFLEGLKAEFPDAKINYVAGHAVPDPDGDRVPANAAHHARRQAGPQGRVRRGYGF